MLDEKQIVISYQKMVVRIFLNFKFLCNNFI